ncbi:hypothetical protein BN3658_00019 [Coriobacteriaceae bacterium CHKCI002]|nr:hypothetical protein BN3658_00019 [Coriobacteriaceae bacterium CHKCI002]
MASPISFGFIMRCAYPTYVRSNRTFESRPHSITDQTISRRCCSRNASISFSLSFSVHTPASSMNRSAAKSRSADSEMAMNDHTP